MPPWEKYSAPSGGPWAKYGGDPGKLSLGQHVVGALSKVNAAIPFGDEIAAGVQTGVNALSGKAKTNLVDDYKDSLAKQRSYEATYDKAAPVASALASGTGDALSMLVPAGRSANALAAAPRITNMARGAVTAGLTGAAYAVADRGTVQERVKAASDAVKDPVTLALGAAGGALAPARKSAPKQRVRQDIVDLRAKGVDVTPGQAAGGLLKGVEDAATSLPIVGGAIQDARLANLGTFNHAVANEALKPIGKRVPASVAPGHETVAYVERALGGEYDKIIPKGGVKIDPEFGTGLGDLSDIVSTMQPRNQKRLANILDQRLKSRFEGGQMDGPTYQRVQSELKYEINRFSGKGDADEQAIGEALKGVSTALQDAAARQNPAFAARKRAIDRGYAEFKRLQGATVATGAAADGVFSAGQYGGAIKKADKSLDKGRYARGDALGQDLAGSAARVLPSSVPDSGAATRSAIGAVVSAPAVIGAGFATGGPVGALSAAGGIAGTVGALKLASKAYTPRAIEAFNKALDETISAQASKAALTELAQLAAKDSKLEPLYREASIRLSRAAGAYRGNAEGQPGTNALAPANSAR